MIKSYARKAGAALLVVIHDKQVQREGRKALALAVVRGLIALGASAQVVELVHRLLG